MTTEDFSSQKTRQELTFVGERLTEAREARGLSKSSLAQIAGLKKQSISNYENGKQKPKAEALAALSQVLNVNIAFFQKAPFLSSSSPVFFRALSGIAKREYSRARIQLAWFEEIYDYLDSMINFMPPNIPRHFDISSHINKITMEDIDEIAMCVRQYWGLGKGPISSMTRLLENNGVVIIKMMLDVKDEDAFSQWQRNNTLPVIVSVADTPSACRDRFSLAHELGHLILHSQVEITSEILPIIEKQAHRFAAAFLMPAQSYAKEFRFPTLDILLLLKEKWKVSLQAQIHRCKDLGMLCEKDVRNFYININRRGWRKNEPLDESILPENPVMIKEALELLKNEIGIDIETISQDTSIPEIDIRILFNIAKANKELDLHTSKPGRIIKFTCPKKV